MIVECLQASRESHFACVEYYRTVIHCLTKSSNEALCAECEALAVSYQNSLEKLLDSLILLKPTESVVKEIAHVKEYQSQIERDIKRGFNL